VRVLLQTLERDRSAVASALRAETAQVLATLLVSLAAFDDCDDLDEVRAGLRELREAVRVDLERVQSLATRIQSSVLDDLGLAPALEAASRSLTRSTGPVIEVDHPAAGVELPAIEQTLVFRILEEAMRNAVAHAEARQIAVRLAETPTGLEFEVRDDGHGFDMNGGSTNPTSGLALMRAQARAIGGRLDVTSSRGLGTRVLLQVPQGTAK